MSKLPTADTAVVSPGSLHTLNYRLQQYVDWEIAYISSAISTLVQGNYKIKRVSLSKDFVQSISGFKVLPDYDVASVPGDYEALILIGGRIWRSEKHSQLRHWQRIVFKKEDY